MIRNQRAFTAGALFLAFALFGYYQTMGLSMGTAIRMGAGYFPRMLSILLGVIGLLVIAGALSPRAVADKLERWDIKGLLWITGSVALFAFLLEPAGFVISLIVLVISSSLASTEFTWRGTLVNAVVLTALGVGVFNYGINLRFPLWPAFLIN
jgi:hypothetical protein